MKILTISLFVLISIMKSNAQIVLDTTFCDISGMGEIELSQSGKKFITVDTNNIIKIYNTDFSIYKVIDFPELQDSLGWSLYFFSDNLFDLDGDIEFVAARGWSQYPEIPEMMKIFDENGNVEFDYGPLQTNGFWGTLLDQYSQAKLLIMDYSFISNYYLYKVYDLPGRMPCSSCNPTNMIPNQTADGKFEIYPNPTNSGFNINFQLPNNSKEGKIILTDISSRTINTSEIKENTGYAKFSTNGISSGNYVIKIYTNTGIIKSKKVIITK